jgi:transcriptional regulator GlxA family with amidase domain
MACRVVFVLFPAFQQLDLAGPMAAFELAERERPGSYTWRLAASRSGRVWSSARTPWHVTGLPRTLERSDLVMVIGGDGVDQASRDDRLIRWLVRAGRSGARISSICSGSLVLAASGLLDHRAATTHWSRQRQFETKHPQVQLDADRIYVRQTARRSAVGNCPEIWTSAGMTAGIDLCLALISQDHGEDLARQVARHLVVERRRPGGQSQFSSLLDLQRPEGRFGPLLDHVRTHLAENHSVPSLAARVFMSERHFARAFKEETGSTPAHAVERLRVEAARSALDQSGASVQRVALVCGFGNTERMRRSFRRLLGRPPAALTQKPKDASRSSTSS